MHPVVTIIKSEKKIAWYMCGFGHPLVENPGSALATNSR
jgi:hypothetical protein